MITEPNQSPEQPAFSSHADLFFKIITHLEAAQAGLQALDTEVQSLVADFILKILPGKSTADTMFDFFRVVNVVEFKSQNDQLTLQGFIKNVARTYLQFLREKDEDFENILNVTVSSRLPQSFFDETSRQGVTFKQDTNKPWL